jgi:hypothetical protein
MTLLILLTRFSLITDRLSFDFEFLHVPLKNLLNRIFIMFDWLMTFFLPFVIYQTFAMGGFFFKETQNLSLIAAPSRHIVPDLNKDYLTSVSDSCLRKRYITSTFYTWSAITLLDLNIKFYFVSFSFHRGIHFDNEFDSKHKYPDVNIKMLEFIIDNMFVVFGNKSFQQTDGIPMDSNCVPLLGYNLMKQTWLYETNTPLFVAFNSFNDSGLETSPLPAKSCKI